MAIQKKVIGKLPVPRGEYKEGTSYGELNLVTRYGSTYMSKHDNNTTAPATLSEDGKVVVNTNDWEVYADASGAYEVEEKLTELENKIEESKELTAILDGSAKNIVFYKNQNKIPSIIQDKLFISVKEGIEKLKEFPFSIYSIDESFGLVESFSIKNGNLTYISQYEAIIDIDNIDFYGIVIGISSANQLSNGEIKIELSSFKLEKNISISDWTFNNVVKIKSETEVYEANVEGSTEAIFAFRELLEKNKKYLVRLVTDSNIVDARISDGGNLSENNLSKYFSVVDTSSITNYFQVYLRLDKIAPVKMQWCLYSLRNEVILKLYDSDIELLNNNITQTNENSSSISQIKNEIYSKEDTIIDSYSKEDFTEKGILKSDGSFESKPTDQYYVTDFIELGEANKIKFSGMLSFGGGVSICFYAENNYESFIESITQENGDAYFPQGAKYIKAGYTPWASNIFVSLIKETLSNNSRIEVIDRKINGTKVIILDKSGNGDYTEIDDAIDNANDSADSPTTIIVMPGTYIAKQKDSTYRQRKNNRYLNIIGVNKHQCIISNSNGAYTEGVDYVDNSCLSFAGNCLIKNLTVKSTHENYDSETHGDGWCRAYCIHVDSNMDNDNTFEVNNCILINDHHACVGIGGRSNTIIKFTDCEIEHSSIYDYWEFSAPFFIHEVNGLTNFKFIAERLKLKSDTHEGFNIQYNSLGGGEYAYVCEFINNILKLPIGKKAISSNNTILLGDFSYGNNYQELNNTQLVE